MVRAMTNGDAGGQTPGADISARKVWIFTAALFAILLTLALIDPFILTGPPTRLGRHSELGLLEQLQNALLLTAFITALACLPRAKERWLRIWLIVIAVGIFWLLGEEISWGQHYFNWETGAWFSDLNDQDEINIHNTPGGWFDQKPRAILLLGMILGTIVHPLVKRFRGRGLFDHPWWLAPTLVCLALGHLLSDRLGTGDDRPPSYLAVLFADLPVERDGRGVHLSLLHHLHAVAVQTTEATRRITFTPEHG
ncbi:MAG: hypothetical protein R3C16_07635 [Hyphomonadaceae bacterium]